MKEVKISEFCGRNASEVGHVRIARSTPHYKQLISKTLLNYQYQRAILTRTKSKIAKTGHLYIKNPIIFSQIQITGWILNWLI